MRLFQKIQKTFKIRFDVSSWGKAVFKSDGDRMGIGLMDILQVFFGALNSTKSFIMVSLSIFKTLCFLKLQRAPTPG